VKLNAEFVVKFVIVAVLLAVGAVALWAAACDSTITCPLDGLSMNRVSTEQVNGHVLMTYEHSVTDASGQTRVHSKTVQCY
jgi:hypothetical protein